MLTAAIATACGGGTGSDGAGAAPGEPAADASAAPPPGLAHYDNWGCTMCHASNRKGTNFGPPLLELGPHWTVDDLAAYLADPPAFHDRERLKEMVAAYEGMVMPATEQPEDKRRELAEWLLTDSR